MTDWTMMGLAFGISAIYLLGAFVVPGARSNRNTTRNIHDESDAHS